LFNAASKKVMLKAIALAGPNALRALICSGAAALEPPAVKQWMAANPEHGYQLREVGTCSSSWFQAAAAPSDTQQA
jgi:hypothetical protein